MHNIWITLLVILALSLIIWLVPKWQVIHLEQLSPDKLFKLENEARKTIAQGLAGLAVLFGLYVAWRRVEVTEEGHVTERFTRAIDQLGNKDSMEVRLGGIYALDRIGKDSPKDRKQIIEILTAYIRNNAAKEDGPEIEEDIPAVLLKSKAVEVYEIKELSTDIKDIFSILYNENGWPMEFRNKNNLKYDFSHSDLSRRNLYKIRLDNCNLYRASFKQTILDGANLYGSNLAKAKLHKAHIVEANLKNTDLIHADLTNACIGDFNLENANLIGASLQGARLYFSNLQGAGFEAANLEGASLIRTDLTEATGLTCEQIDSIEILDKETKFPEYLKVEITGENKWTCKNVNKEMDLLDLGDHIDNP